MPSNTNLAPWSNKISSVVDAPLEVTLANVTEPAPPDRDWETFLTAAEPTVDRTITLPNVSGTVITSGNLTNTGLSTGDALATDGDALAYGIVFGG